MAVNLRRAIPLPSTRRKDATPMTGQGDEWHTMNPPIEEAVEIPYDPADMGPGTFTIEVTFDMEELDRMYAGIPYGPIGITRFIKNAALAEADRLAAERECEELPQTD